MMRRNDSRGETTVQAVLVVPVILTILFVGAHVTAYVRGSQVANAAAVRGAQVAASVEPDATGTWSALREIDAVVADLGFRTAAAPAIEVGPRNARATVSLVIHQIVPFLPNVVTRSAWVPREVFLREQDR